MIWGLAIGLGVFLFPCLFLRFRQGRGLTFCLPWVLLLHTVILGALSALSGKSAYHFSWLSGMALLSAILSWRIPLALLQGKRFPLRSLPFSHVALLTLVVMSDLFLIYFRNGWNFADGSLFPHSETYLRAPLHSDNFRNVFLIGALGRDDGSPFLAGAKLVYQLFWFHLAAVIAIPIDRMLNLLTSFQIVQGVSLAFNFAAYLSLLLVIFSVRPTLFRKGLGLLVLTIAFAHADLASVLFSYWQTGAIGLEADWSYAPEFYRNFSLKLLGLPSPQHLYFIWALSLYWYFYRWPRRRQRFPLQLTSAALAVLISPSMAALLLPALALADLCLRRSVPTFTKSAVGWCLAGAAGLICYALLLGNPFSVLIRPGISQVEIFPWNRWFAALPFFPVIATGMLGLLAMLVPLSPRWRTQKKNPTLQTALIFSLLIGVFLQFGITGLEIRRHVAMGLCVSLLIWVVRLFPIRFSFQGDAQSWRRLTVVLSVLAVVLQGYFVYTYVGKPSTLDPKLPWRDYFAMNRIIREKYPGMAVVVATEPTTENIVLPPVMEVTSSFAFGGHVLVHSELTPEAITILSRLQNSADFVPYAARLGYRGILWGPIEEKIWGEPFRRRFISPGNRLAEAGEVSLYALTDNLWQEWKARGGDQTFSAQQALATADWLTERGWCLEAMDTLKEGMVLSSNPAPYWRRIATCLYHRRQFRELEELLTKGSAIGNDDDVKLK